MISRVFMICDAYESGIGHGLQRDGLSDGAAYFADPEHAEAYELGYDLGEERSQTTAGLPSAEPMNTNVRATVGEEMRAKFKTWASEIDPVSGYKRGSVISHGIQMEAFEAGFRAAASLASHSQSKTEKAETLMPASDKPSAQGIRATDEYKERCPRGHRWEHAHFCKDCICAQLNRATDTGDKS
jgi:hypothetical protein